MPSFFKNLFAVIATSLSLQVSLISCTTMSPQFTNDATKKHPATKVFRHYSLAIKKVESFESLTDFFSLEDNRQIAKSIGWYRFAYSASYKALKGGYCETLTTTPINATNAQIDCIGIFIYESYFTGKSEENMHLRVYMTKQQETWFVSKSGYAHTQAAGTGQELARVGIQFKTSLLGRTLP